MTARCRPRLFRAKLIGITLGLVALVAAGTPAAAAQEVRPENIEPLRLPDQSGSAQVLGPSERHTLLVFYRGDW